MSIDENKAIIRRVFDEALNLGKLELVDKLFTTNFVDHSTPEQATGPAGVKDFFSSVRSSFPDLHVSIDDIIAEDSRVVVRTTWQGTHLGRYAGKEPDGKRVDGTLIQIFHLENGQIIEEWNEGSGLEKP
ncbi:MAG: ester cyclase [Ktedonobacteraceae bacterium]|nr:ester cyclase [Ktedonobacteraceae bacterium]